MKAGVDLTPGFAGLARDARQAAGGGRQIDAGFWSASSPRLHACFMSLHGSMVRQGCSAGMIYEVVASTSA